MNPKIKCVLELLIKDRAIFIYGCGRRGRMTLKCLKGIGANIKGFIDENPFSSGFQGYEIPCFLYEKQVVDGAIIVTPKMDADSIYRELVGLGNEVMPLETVDILCGLTYTFSHEYGYERMLPVTHFYSPYPDLNWCKRIERNHHSVLMDVELNEEKQKTLLNKMRKFYTDLPNWNKDTKLRYSYPNSQYGIEDALVHHCLLRIICPKRLIEIGSGYSSAVTLDTNEFYLEHSIQLHFIEPYPVNLKKILRKDDSITLQVCILQEADYDCFDQLESGDILFIDSTHVSKRDSDVNMILFEIIPKLKRGVYIHFHDVFDDFEYPIGWNELGRVWNEDYLLRAFLMNNTDYEIIFFNSYMKKYIEEDFPYDSMNSGGGLWIRKK